MELAVFWDIVEGARAEAGADSERVAQALIRRLRAVAPDDLEGFQECWEQVQEELYWWPLHDAAELFLGPVDDDALWAVQD